MPSNRPKLSLASATVITKAIWVSLIVAFVAGLFTARYAASFLALGTFILTLVPFFVARKFDVYVPRRFMAAIILFIFATLFLGEVVDFYNRYWWWDVVLHGGSALGFGLIGFLIVFMMFQGDRFAAPPLAIGLFGFCFALSIGALWEVFEYAMDQTFGMSMQKNGLQDTMWDLIVDAIGGLIGSGAGVIYLIRDSDAPFATFFRDIITQNKRLFAKYRSK
ncbi:MULTISPECIES: hypothetical protein [Pacificibacter]|uniref:hypothetical protein n=1 Tax=Pacificibacter TaxID=1042323 RepID=UPI001C0A61CA|nr:MULTISPECIES: hypothetical protein [Pacificibacter]MBU2935608.1 hypothetical protein [Pacificibacter marinus]MDO6614104.1 hypothetical protein [Pacificibacter sp. 1_MG-2023]